MSLEVKEEKKSLANREIMFEANGIFILNPQKRFPKSDGQKWLKNPEEMTEEHHNCKISFGVKTNYLNLDKL